MFSGFQSNAFQSNAFQIVTAVKRADPNGNLLKSYVPYGYELERYQKAERLQQLQRKEELARQDLISQEIKIEQLEIQRLKKGLADKNLQYELLKLLSEQYVIKAALAQYHAEIEELLLEHEAVMVLMLCMEF